MKPALAVRVNGVVIRRVKIREYICGGQPTGEHELVIFDPVLGSFAVDDSFVFEIKDLNLPAEAHAAQPNEGWHPVKLKELIETLAAESDRQLGGPNPPDERRTPPDESKPQ